MEASEIISLQELRIGNLLAYKGKISYVSFLSMDIDDEYTDIIGVVELGKRSNEKADWNRALVNDLKRVPLTGEWLKKLGFKKDEQHECFVIHQNDQFSIEFYDNQVQQVGHESADSMDHIKYVHQLQNLYFALTGEELTIKA